MDIYVISREIIVDRINNGVKPCYGEWALISIYSFSEGPVITPETVPILNALDCKFISLKFCDIKLEEFLLLKKAYPEEVDGSDLFNEDHAKIIIRFLDEIKQIQTLVVHCAAGISRSGAVGLFANRYLEQDDSIFRKRNKGISPNPYVLDVLNKASGIDANYVNFWNNELEKNDRMKRIMARIKFRDS